MTRGEIAKALGIERYLVTPIREPTPCTGGFISTGYFCSNEATWNIHGEDYCDEHLKQIILVALAMEES